MREITGLICPKCQGPTQVMNSRGNEGRTSIRRRRKCKKCGHRFSTVELIVAPGLNPQVASDLIGSARQALALAQASIGEARQQLENVSDTHAAITGRV